MDQRGSGGQKRARGDGSTQAEGDWTCPECGNVNFAFRNTCNLRKCGASKPSLVQRGAPINPPSMYNAVVASPYVGGPGIAPYGMQIGVSPAASLPYDYSSSFNMSSYTPSYPSTYPPYSSVSAYGPSVGGGYGYGSGPVMNGPYGMELNMPRGPMMAGLGFGISLDDNGSRKRRGDLDGMSEGDWVCPKCGNKNFAFRTVCNMRTCAAPKPSAPAPRMQGQSSGNAPEGSWTCEKCGNINYPFRAKCNRKSCGADKPAENKEATEVSE